MGTFDWASIGNRIVKVRNKKPRDAFSEEINSHKNTLANYETGKRKVDVDFLEKMHNYGININWLVTGEGSMYRDDLSKEDDEHASGDFLTGVLKDALTKGKSVKDLENILKSKTISLMDIADGSTESMLMAGVSLCMLLEVYEHITPDGSNLMTNLLQSINEKNKKINNITI